MRVFLCVCVFLFLYLHVRRKKNRGGNSGNQSESDSLALSMSCRSGVCVCVYVCIYKCVLVPAYVYKCFVATEEAWSEVPSCPSQHSQSQVLRRPPAGPIIWHKNTRTRQTHTSVSAAGGLLLDHKPQESSEPAENSRCQSEQGYTYSSSCRNDI